MSYRDFAKYQRRIHHRATFHLNDGSKIEGFMQPWSQEYLYYTDIGGESGGKIKLSELRSIDFPND